jgi:disease resistance protein RPM1
LKLVTQKDISNIGLLHHLKHVNIKGFSSMYALRRSTGKLHGLQELEVTGGYISTLPIEICKLKSLCTLSFECNARYEIFDQNEPMNYLTNSLCLAMIFTLFVDSEVHNIRIAELHMAYSSCWLETDGVC